MTEQTNKWENKFGDEYTDRNIFNVEELDNVYYNTFGITATELAKIFLNDFDRNIKILEVGSNVGNQLVLLKSLGFNNLYGIEISKYAIQKSKDRDLNIIQGSALDLPFRDNYFDLVFTSGVLIHISPNDINTVLSEIFRCSNKYIFGFEYFSKDYTEILYHGNKNLLWKGDFENMYKKLFNLKTITEKKVFYENGNVDSMFLLKK